MRGYLLDTDTCVNILRGNEEVIKRRRGVYLEVVTSEITASELYFGAARSADPMKNKRRVDEFLQSLRVIPIGRQGAQFFGVVKAMLKADGTLIPDADLWIGSISRAQKLTVVTGNKKHLGRIPGVLIEDWIRG